MSSLNIARPEPFKLKITTCKLHDIDLDVFRSDILNLPLYTSPASDLDFLVRQYDTVLRDLKDKYAQLTTRTVRCRPMHRGTMIFWDKRNVNSEDLKGFPSNLKLTSNFLKTTAKRTILQSSMPSKHTIKNNLLAVIQSISSGNSTNYLHQISQNHFLLISDTSDDALANRFSQFLVIRFKGSKTISAIQRYQTYQIVQIQTYVILHFLSFHRYLKNRFETSSWNHHLLHVVLIIFPHGYIKCVSELQPIVTKIISLSFESGKFPTALKSALITPLKRNQIWTMKCWKTIHMLPIYHFLQKTVECTCACQIQDYLVTHKLREKMQSAY